MEVTRLQGIFKLLSVSETESGIKLLLNGKRGDLTALYKGDDLDSVMELCGEDIRVTGVTEGKENIVKTVVPHNGINSSKTDESDNTDLTPKEEPEAKIEPTYNEFSLIIKWYAAEFPTDEDALERMSVSLNFRDCYMRMKNGEDFYQIIGFPDSVTRERIFTKMSGILGIEYGEIHDTWMKNASYVNKKRPSELAKEKEEKSNSLVEEGEALSPDLPLEGKSGKADVKPNAGIEEDKPEIIEEGQNSLFDILGFMKKSSVVKEKTDNKKAKPKEEKKIKSSKVAIDKDELITLIKEAVREVLSEERA